MLLFIVVAAFSNKDNKPKSQAPPKEPVSKSDDKTRVYKQSDPHVTSVSEHESTYVPSEFSVSKYAPTADIELCSIERDLYGLSTYTCIDFETATGLRDSACQVGLVQVKDGLIVSEECYLIRPPFNEYHAMNSRVHGIRASDTEGADSFDTLWPKIKSQIDGQVIVAHNASFDYDVLLQSGKEYGIEPSPKAVYCTYLATNLPLVEAIQAYGQHPAGHHNALEDAKMCAVIAKNLSAGIQPDEEKISVRKGGKKESSVKPVSEASISGNSILSGKGVLATGVFGTWTRDDIHNVLLSKGAIIKSGITRKVDYVILGVDAGPAKLRKIEELRDAGHHIEILTEDEMLDLIKRESEK